MLLRLVLAAMLVAGSAQAADQVDMSRYYDPGRSYFNVSLNCSDATIDNPETEDTITVTAWNGDQLLSHAYVHGIQCHVWWDPNRQNHNFLLDHFDDAFTHGTENGSTASTEHQPTHLIIETDGSDAFFIDWMVFEQQSGMDRYGMTNKWRRNGSWGTAGVQGHGWCLSTDPNDRNGDWVAVTDVCAPALRLDIATGKITPVQATTLAAWDVRIDCVHSLLPLSDTTRKLTLSLYDANRRLLGRATRAKFDSDDHRKDLTCEVDERNDGYYDSQFMFLGASAIPSGAVANMVLEIAAPPDWWKVEQKIESRFFVDQIWLNRNRMAAGRWGGNEGLGWCLSQEPASYSGAWVIASQGCFKGIRYEVATLKAYAVK